MSQHIIWNEVTTLVDEATLTKSTSNTQTVNLRQLGADVIHIQAEVTFHASATGNVVLTFFNSVDDGTTVDDATGATLATLTVTCDQGETVAITQKLEGYPHVTVVATNADASYDQTLTVRYRTGYYKD